MKQAIMRLGPWRIERTLGRDVCGTYYAGILDDGARATLLLPASELSAAPEPLGRLLERHRDLAHGGVIGFRSLDEDGDEPFLIGDAVDDVMASFHRGVRPDPGQTRPVGAALAAALLALHDRGVVHGNLELDNVLWAPDEPARILGPGAAALGIAGAVGHADGDVMGLGRLLCALVASWPRRDTLAALSVDELRTVELVRMIADPGAAISMRRAYALLAGEAMAATHRGADAVRTHDRTHDHAPGGRELALCRADAPDPTDPALEPLDSHLGRYRILTRLGCGGMGEVFLAEDPTLRRGVAIKRIRPMLQRDRVFRGRLRREAQLAASLSHRAIVQVFDLITERNIDHVVMEYVAGPSLHALLAGKPMPVAEAVVLATEIADALGHAHQRGIVHRDLKLENILIGTDGQPKIADFGIARWTASDGDTGCYESLTRDGVMVGTTRAMSPEQIQCRDVDARSDLFSFGVMLYELVTGTTPFAASNAAMIMLRVLNDRHAPVCTRMPEVPVALSDLIDHLLEKDPAQRPQTARAVRDRLRRLLAGPEPRDADGPRDRPSSPIIEAEPARRPAGITVAAGSREIGRPLAVAQDHAAGHAMFAGDGSAGNQPAARRSLTSRIQAPFVLAEIRALRSSIFKWAPEIRNALAIARKVEDCYDLKRPDLFIPAGDTWCAILEPFAMTVLTGTLRRIGYEIFPQYVSLLGISMSDVRTAMDLRTPTDLVRVICDAYHKCVIGSDAGALTTEIDGSRAMVTDTTIMPCQLQMGVFLGAGKLTGLFGDSVVSETRCRARGDTACAYEFAF